MGESEGKSMLYLEARCLCARPRRRLAGRSERLDLVRRARALGARRHARGAGRERARRLARPRGGVRQRRDREPLRDPQDREADGAVPAGHGLRHLRLLVDAALRQHVRRRQLRLARLRRVADDPARLAGRRRDRAARRGGRGRRARARRRAPCRRCSRSSASRRSRDEEVRLAATCLDSRDLPDRDRAADVLAGDRVLAEGISGLDVARALDAARLRRRRRRGLRHAAAARRGGLPADVGDHRRRRHGRLGGQRPERLPRPGHRLPPRRRALGAAAAAAARDRRAAARRGRPRRATVAELGGRCRRRGRTRSSSRSGRRSADALGRRSAASRIADVLAALLDGVRDAGGAPRLVRVRRSADVAFIGHDGARSRAPASRSGCSRRGRR